MLISWERYPGELVEEVVAILLLREHPAGRHFRPSRGDGGIDVLIPSSDGSNPTNYQIKKFAGKIESSQKGQIRQSLRRMQASRNDGNTTADKCLIAVPTLPSTSDERWLQNYAERFDFSVDWFGITHIEGLASKYPEVIDYFFNDGREKVDLALANLSTLVRDMNRTAARYVERSQEAGSFDSDQEPEQEESRPHLDPSDIIAQLSRLQFEINRVDPLYKYEFQLLTSDQPVTQKPRLVASVTYNFGENNLVRVDVIARFEDAVNFRPCRINVTLAPKTEDEKTAFAEWERFGTGMTMTARASIDLPGGLGMETEEGLVRVTPSAAPAGSELVYEVLSPEGESLDEILCIGDEASTGASGENHYFKAHDLTDTFSAEWWFDKEANQTQMRFQVKDVEGKLVVDVQQALTFLASLTQGNRLRISLKFGPRTNRPIELQQTAAVDLWQYMASLADDLAAIQRVVKEPITFPDHTSVEPEKRLEIRRLAVLAQGHSIGDDWASPEQYPVGEAEIDAREEHAGTATAARAIVTVLLELQGKQYNIGRLEITYESAYATILEIDGIRCLDLKPGESNRAVSRLITDPE